MIRQLLHKWDNTSLHPRRLFYLIVLGAAALFALSYFNELLFVAAELVLVLCAIATIADVIVLYHRNGISAQRIVKERLSNGDDNRIDIQIVNDYGFKVLVTVIDELPYQLQERKWKREVELPAGEDTLLTYSIKPAERGVYAFGDINIYVHGPLQLVKRRYRALQSQSVKVYPSYVQMRRYQLIAVGTYLQESGVKRMRKLGQSMEFEQIKEYVRGDDHRTVNWKATARKGDLMVNNFTDERSQQIYCIVNKGRVMKMPFEGMTLLDYAINSALVLSNVALHKQDKAGLICYSQQLDSFIQADKKPTQINAILESLYKQETDFVEPDMEKLFSVVRNRISHRSLLILFTNFESIESLERELPTLKRLAHYHLLMVVFFENTELRELTDAKAGTVEEIYIKTIADKFRYEKQLMVRELQKHGIIAVLTTPQNLTVTALNKYLELKNRSSI